MGTGNSALQAAALDAAGSGDAATLRELLSKHRAAVVAARSRLGSTALHHAIERGHSECVALLLAAAAAVDATNDDGETPLRAAATLPDETLVDVLIAAGARVNASDKRGWTPLLPAAALGRDHCVAALLRGGADANAATAAGLTPLHWAAVCGRAGCAALLLRADADPTATLKTSLSLGGREWPAGTKPLDLALRPAVEAAFTRAMLRSQLVPLIAAAARGGHFEPRLYDAALWRVVARFAAHS
jgi:ankyrin repeat protein